MYVYTYNICTVTCTYVCEAVVYMMQLLSTAEEVAKLQAELEEMQPQLEQAQIATEQTMEKIKQDSGTVHVHVCVCTVLCTL